MYSKFKIKSIVPRLIMPALAVLFMGSCTVYKYPEGMTEDGIYSSSRTYRGQADGYAETNNYYKQYFQSKQGSYSELLAEDNQSAVFTDVEAYNSREYVGEDGYVYTENISEQEQGYAGWGDNQTSVNINLYGYGGGYYNSFYGNWGFPYYPYSYRYGYYSPRWYGGFSWWYGWNGFYSPFYYPSYYYGYGSYNYYRPYYNNVSYNRGRRNSDYRGRSTTTGGRTANYNATRGRSAVNADGRRGSSNSTLSRREATNGELRRNTPANTNARNSNTLNTNTRREATSPARRVTFPQQSTQRSNKITPSRSQQMRRQTPINNRTQRPSSPRSNTRSSSPSRNSSPTMRSSSPSRSSGPTMRASSPSRSSAPASRGSSRGRR